jgi:superfamily II DNA or RNA helicase
MTRIEELRREIEALEIQKRAKEREIRQLQDAPTPSLVFAEGFAGQSANLRSGDKIALMLELFGARRDVYGKYW